MDSYTNPYVSPASDPQVELAGLPNETTSIYGAYRDPRGLAKTLKLLLVVCGTNSAVLGCVNMAYYSVLNVSSFELDLNKAESIESMMAGYGILTIIVYLSTIVVFAMWTNRMMKNTWAIQGSGSPVTTHLTTPGGAVGWYFCPLLNLWKPLNAVQEMRDVAFVNGGRLSLAPWWATWLISNFIGRISMKMPTETLDNLQSSALFDAVTSPIEIASAVFAFLMVKKLTNKQHEVVTG